MHEKGALPKQSKSYWRDSSNIQSFPQLQDDLNVDVAVVGGGITGLTSAYLLMNAGLKVAVIEADKLLNGTTGHTTAKVTAQHDIFYDELIATMGRSKARMYYEANMDALNFIKKIVKEEEIECNFVEGDAYIFATTDEGVEQLNKEAAAYKTLHIDGELVSQIPLKELKSKKALVMKNQAQFHPLHYLTHLVKRFIEGGGEIYEGTTAVKVESTDSDQRIVFTRDDKKVYCRDVLICSHFPFYEGIGLYSGKLTTERAYIIAIKTKTPYRGGMYINAEQPARSLRSVTINGEEMILIAGEGHKAGQGESTLKHYEALEQFGRDTFGEIEIVYRWSAQDLTTLDKVPYIGEITANEEHVFVATGFRKWGMSTGTAAALLLNDKVLKKGSKYDHLYSPSRFYANPSLKNFFKENADVVKHLVKGKLEVSNKRVDELKNDEGSVIMINGHRKGAYKDQDGKLHIVDTTCTHVGCEVEWNDGERTWDCPCHGSRFSYNGDVVEGPAEKPLQSYDYRMIDNLLSDDSGY